MNGGDPSSSRSFDRRQAVLPTLVLLCGLTWSQTSEAASTDEALAGKVKALVGRQGLGHEELAKREAAEKELIALGPSVLPLLPAVTARTPAEDKVRLKRVRDVLEKAELAKVLQPSLVTLKGEMPVSQAIAKIMEQTGNKLMDYRERFNQDGADPKITVAL